MSEHKVSAARISELEARIKELTDKLAQQKTERELEARVRELETAEAQTADMPCYKLNAGVYLADTFIPEGCEVQWLGEPNEAMVPQNQPARDKWNARMERLREAQQAFAAAHEMPFHGLVTDRETMLAQAGVFARRAAALGMKPIAVPEMPKPDAPVHGGMMNPDERRRRSAEQLKGIREPVAAPRQGLAGMAANTGMDFGIPVTGANRNQVFGG